MAAIAGLDYAFARRSWKARLRMTKEEVRRELKEFDGAVELLNRALQLEPNHALARATLAGIYEERRELERAVEEWKKLLALPAGEGKDAAVRRAEYWAHLGFAYGELERHAESVEAFAQAKELGGGDERFDTFYIQSLLEADRPKDARAAIEKALRQNPRSARLRVLETRVLDANGEPEKAVARALELVRAEPDNETLIQGVVELYQRQKDYAGAEAFLREKVERHPGSPGLRFQLAAVLERLWGGPETLIVISSIRWSRPLFFSLR